MDITPNMTTVIQMLNFSIAYGMIRVLLCKPVLGLLQQEEHQIAQLHTEIKARTQLKNITKDAHYHQWYTQHQFFIVNRPVVDDVARSVSVDKYSYDQKQEPTTQEIDRLVESLRDNIVNKVLHGNQ